LPRAGGLSLHTSCSSRAYIHGAAYNFPIDVGLNSFARDNFKSPSGIGRSSNSYPYFAREKRFGAPGKSTFTDCNHCDISRWSRGKLTA
jgi:hypothetical protein